MHKLDFVNVDTVQITDEATDSKPHPKPNLIYRASCVSNKCCRYVTKAVRGDKVYDTYKYKTKIFKYDAKTFNEHAKCETCSEPIHWKKIKDPTWSKRYGKRRKAVKKV